MWFLDEDRSNANNQESDTEYVPNLEFSQELAKKSLERVVYLNVGIAEMTNGKRKRMKGTLRTTKKSVVLN